MQASMFVLVLFSTSYAPQRLLHGFMSTAAQVNPVTKVLQAVRQGFLGHVAWAGTWPALVVIAALLLVFGAFALRGISRMGV
jgi:ABC-2 type transport system permease protein